MTKQEDEDDGFERAHKRRNLITLVAGVLVVGLLVGLWAYQKSTGLPSLDREQEKNVREALPEIARLPPDVRRAFAAQALAELENERLPPALVEVLDDYAGAPPDFAALVLLEPFTKDEAVQTAWKLACPAGPAAIAKGAQEGTRATYDRCELERHGLLSKDEAVVARLGEVVVAHAVWAHLAEHDAETELERKLLHMLMTGG